MSNKLLTCNYIC